MNIAIILASGKGLRFGESIHPKQYVKLNNKPIVIYPIETFSKSKYIDKIIVTSNSTYIHKLQTWIKKYVKNDKNIFVIEGSSNRNLSIQSALKFIQKEFDYINSDDVILIHDGVRIFVTNEIIKENIVAMEQNDVVSTAINSIDTIATCDINKNVKSLEDRKNLYNIQTPQCLKYKIFDKYFQNNVIDTSDLISFLLNKGYQGNIKIVQGDHINFKITNTLDFELAKLLIKQKDK